MGDFAQIDSIEIGDHKVGRRHPAFVIAEVGLAHDGSLGSAHAYVDAAAEAGVSAIKFQTHIAEAESTPSEPFRAKVFCQDATRLDYWRRTSFTREQWRELADHVRQSGLVFLSSPFSFAAMDWLLDCRVAAWKVASGEVCNYPMLRRMAKTGLPVLLSSGMSGWQELDQAVSAVAEAGGFYGLFQCITAYPCPPQMWGLNVLGEMADRYRCPVGLSDHSGTIAAGLAAVLLDACMVEFHVAFHRKQFGPDVPASLLFEQAAELVRAIRDVEKALASPVDKDAEARRLQPIRDIFTKSIVSSRELPAGTVLTGDDLALKKPGTGIPPARLDEIVGRRLARDVRRDHLITTDDLAQE